MFYTAPLTFCHCNWHFGPSGFVVKLCFALCMKPVCELTNNATDPAFYFADLICRTFVGNIPLLLSIRPFIFTLQLGDMGVMASEISSNLTVCSITRPAENKENIEDIKDLHHCPACLTTLIATRFWVVMICPIIKCLTVLRVFFYFVCFVFIHHNFQFYFELCTYCNILDIYLS